MEKELLETFEVAKKAADAADDGGGSPEVDRCLDALGRLREIPVTVKYLVDTQVGKRLRYLTKHPEKNIQAVASDLLKFWKNVVLVETAKDKKKNNTPRDKKSLKVEVNSERAVIVKVEKVSKAGAMKVGMVSRSHSLKVEMVSRLQTVKVGKKESGYLQVNVSNPSMSERIPKEENEATASKNPPPATIHTPKLTLMVKCDYPVRDKLRELLAEAFSRVSKETSESDREEVRDICDEVDACDPIRVAVTVESALFEKLGPSNGEHKVKYRSIMFNLKDSKNTDFRRRVLLGQVEPENLAEMAPEEMASEERKLANQQIKDKAMFDCQRAAAPKASTDQFKCGRCGQRKCTYFQLQTRSADEPMTTFVTCVNCNNHWKFC